MSHFSVMVLTDGEKTVEELLAPYNENLEVDPYIYRTKTQIIKDAKKRKEMILNKIKEAKESHSFYGNSEWQKAFLNAETDEELYQAEINENSIYDKEGNELSTYNPKSKWDWYSIGGRWQGLIKAKNGVKANDPGIFGSSPYAEDDNRFDCALIKDINFTPDEEELKHAKRYWEVVIEGSPLKPGEDKEDFMSFRTKEYYLERYKNKETYAKISSSFVTYAVITPDGQWHEKGQMGWWGCSSETGDESLDWDLHFKERFIDTMSPNTVVTIVDCHI